MIGYITRPGMVSSLGTAGSEAYCEWVQKFMSSGLYPVRLKSLQLDHRFTAYVLCPAAFVNVQPIPRDNPPTI